MPRSYTDPKSYDDNHRTWLTQEELQQRARAVNLPVEPFTLEDGREGFHWTGEPDMKMTNAEILSFVEESEAPEPHYQTTIWDRIKFFK